LILDDFANRGRRPLFTVRLAGPRAFFDVVAADEPPFLVNTSLGQTEETPVTLLVKWPALLKRSIQPREGVVARRVVAEAFRFDNELGWSGPLLKMASDDHAAKAED
jgi:hypothetical protein